MKYSDKLTDPRWQKKRLEILERDEWRCQACLATDKTLHVHHLCYELAMEPWDYDGSMLLTLCKDCHAEAPRGLLLDPIFEALRPDAIGSHKMADILLSVVINCLRDHGPEEWIVSRLQEWIDNLNLYDSVGSLRNGSEAVTPARPASE